MVLKISFNFGSAIDKCLRRYWLMDKLIFFIKNLLFMQDNGKKDV